MFFEAAMKELIVYFLRKTTWDRVPKFEFFHPVCVRVSFQSFFNYSSSV
uniref:Uncharacterized protein n=1 Tax=Anguilla anguilla TaxID=7936 RepID=A0A0E9SNU5_ANGAN